MSDEIDQMSLGGPVIVNANFDTSNIVSMKDVEIRNRLIQTLDSCIEVLKSHCGPLSGYALLVSNVSAGEDKTPSVFTRDGIRIMNAVSFMSPLERYIKDLLCYIGERVDNAARDGTTTSMLWSALLLKQILLRYEELRSLNLTLFSINQCVDEFFKNIMKNMDKRTFDIPSLLGKEKGSEVSDTDAINTGAIVGFMQALSSSGGNVELASAIKSIFEKSPKVSWEYTTFSHSGSEDGKAWEIVTDPYDFKISCVGETAQDLTEAYGTEFVRENSKVFVDYNGLVSGSIALEAVRTLIEKFPKDTPLSIISPKFDPFLVQSVDILNNSRGRENKISLWSYTANELYNGKCWNWKLRILPAIAGAELWDPNEDGAITDKYLFHADKLWWKNAHMEFYGIIPNVKEGSSLHPFLSDLEHAPLSYKDGVETITFLLEKARKDHEMDKKLVDTFVEALNLLTTVRCPRLQLGGTTHDQTHNLLIAEDVLGAVLSSITHGFIINGPMALYQAITETDEHKYPADDEVTLEGRLHRLKSLLLAMLENATIEVLSTVYTDKQLSMPLSASVTTYLNSLSEEPHDLTEFISKIKSYEGLTNLSSEALSLGTTYPVLQPRKITNEMLRRVSELVIKFITTDKIVVSGGVKVNEDKK